MTDRTLSRELVLIVVIKLAALALLWWFFVRDVRVEVVLPANGSALTTRSVDGAAQKTTPQRHGGPHGD